MTGSQPQAPVRPVVTIPGYKITEVLGKGGMAIVYLAIQESIGRQVALKILAPDHSDDSFTDRFLREARIISQLAHPNIITIYDAGVHQGYHYMCMEYVPGKNLTQARDNLSRKQKVAIIKQIAMALDYASKKGYVHRDIKPENIMLHEDGRAILTDFGIARSQDVTRGLTQTGKAIGTPYFMSPEQTKGMRVDHRSDIYSLGVVLFQALAGHVPYDGSSIVAIGIKHISEPIPSLPPGMEIFQPIINKCMSKDPAHRYQNAGELHQALEDISEAQLDFIDAKAKALRQSGSNPYAKTQLEQASIEVLANSAASPAVQVAPAIPKIRAQRSDTRIDITDTEDFRRLARRRRRWLFLLLLITIAAATYYQQDRLLHLWQTKLQARVEPYLPQSWRSDKPPPPTVAKPVTPPPAKPVPILKQPVVTAQQEKTTQDVIADVQLYKDKLRINPDDAAARAGLAQARDWFQDKLEKALANKDSDEARHLLTALRRSFPRLQKLPIYARVENRIQQIDNFNAHMEQARVFMAANAVAKPDGANALEEYLAASRIDPNDPAVKQGLQNIAAYYFKKAKTAKADGNLVSAIDSVTIGLQAVANDGPLLALKHELNNAAQQQEQIKQMLQEAAKLMNSDQVIDPPERNALQLYRAILQVSPNERGAINGLQQVQLWLQSKIQTLYDKKQYLPARKLVQRAHAAFPSNSLITTLQKKIDKAIADTYPRISRIAFSTTPVNNLDTKDSLDNLAPGQTLYAGFAFRNFYDANTQLVARLMSGNDQTQYDEQFVNVSGRDGQGRFALRLPTPGSPNGNYIVELYMNKARILKARLSGLH